MSKNLKHYKLFSLNLSSILKKFIKSFLTSLVNFNSNDHLKFYQFDEFILVVIDSIKITHNIEKNNPKRIALSKCQILRVMTLTNWSQKPFTYKVFSQILHPMSYNYIDYMNVWYTCFIYKVISIHGLFNFQEVATPNFQLGLKNDGLSLVY